MPLAPDTGYMPFCPALVVEVVWPDDRWTEIRSKVRGWLKHGSRLVWVADPADSTVEVHELGKPVRELGAGDRIDAGTVLPGFRAKIADLFL